MRTFDFIVDEDWTFLKLLARGDCIIRSDRRELMVLVSKGEGLGRSSPAARNDGTRELDLFGIGKGGRADCVVKFEPVLAILGLRDRK